LRDGDRIPVLDLSGTELEFMTCESLEEILKRVRFQLLDLKNTQISEEVSYSNLSVAANQAREQTLLISKHQAACLFVLSLVNKVLRSGVIQFAKLNFCSLVVVSGGSGHVRDD
jgi:hypothetical protein